MAEPLPCRHDRLPAEGIELNRADEAGTPYLVFRDRECAAGGGARCRQHIIVLPLTEDRLSIGRTAATDVSLAFDQEVSRAHCTLERVGAAWSVVDNGLSRNGSFVNGERVRGSRILRHDDRLKLGNTTITYRAPLDLTGDPTMPKRGRTILVSDAQRRVLVELCRPFRYDDKFATAPTNQEIAGTLYIAVETVKAHLRALFEALGVEDLPQHQKRMQLIKLAFDHDVITKNDFETTDVSGIAHNPGQSRERRSDESSVRGGSGGGRGSGRGGGRATRRAGGDGASGR